MEIHPLEPGYGDSDRARARFRLAARLALAFVALLWLIEASNLLLGLDRGDLGIRPREWAGLVGVLVAPLMHGGAEHLFANTPPLAVGCAMMLHLYPQSSLRVLPAVYLGPGIAVWLFGSPSAHLGASGLVYGLVSYILVAGILRRDRRAIAASLLVCFLYGTLVWGVFPLRTGVSWETHLAAAAIGAVLAFALRHLDVPPRRRYTWENEGASADPREGA